MAFVLTPLLEELNARPTGVNIQAGDILYTVYTLDGALSLWAYGAIVDPSRLGGADPTAAAKAFADNYCWTHPGVPCSDEAYLVSAYGAVIQATLAGQPAPPLPPRPVTDPGTTNIPGVVYSSAAPIPPPPPPIDQSIPAAALGTPGVDTTTPAPTPTPVPTPTPAPTPAPTAPTAAATGPQARAIFGGGDVGEAAGSAVDLTALAAGAVTFGISIVADVIANLFSGLFGGGDVKALQKGLEQLRQATAQGLDELERFSWSIAVGLGRLWQAVAGIWVTFLDALWSWMKRLWQVVWNLVSSVIPKIIQVMRDLRKFLDSIYLKYILPAMRYLLLARRLLALLRALHVPIAAKLDSILGQIQAALFAPFLALAGIVNGYGSWINVLLTNRYLIQRPVFLRSMYAYQSDWINLWWAAQIASQGAPGLPPGAPARAPLSDAEILAEVKLYMASGAGPMAVDVATAHEMAQAAAAAANV